MLHLAVECCEPLSDVRTDADVVLCDLLLEGKALGPLELPVCDNIVPALVLADAIAARYAWPILRGFFALDAYPARGLSDHATDHDRVGWEVFLQELWGCPEAASEGVFYDPTASLAESGVKAVAGRAAIEVSVELPALDASEAEVVVEYRVGGAAIGIARLSGSRRIGAGELRSVVTVGGGFELCRVAVREGLLGAPLMGASLRERLADAAACPRDPLADALAPVGTGVVVCRRSAEAPGSSASRRARLPMAAVDVVAQAARSLGEPIIQVGESREEAAIAYAPDVFPDLVDRRLPPAKTELPPDGAGHVSSTTDRLPILLYHRVTADPGTDSSRPFRVDPDVFEQQLRYLRDAGYRSVHPSEWAIALDRKVPLAGRGVMITFDDGYRDFLHQAWPALDRYGFNAVVFLVAARVGGSSTWDEATGRPADLLSWSEVRSLHRAGVVFGSHGDTHVPMTGLSHAAVVHEAARSRYTLQEELGEAVESFAYPYGDVDPIVAHLVGACGYLYGFTCRRGLSELVDPPLELRRIDVSESRRLEDFAAELTNQPNNDQTARV